MLYLMLIIRLVFLKKLKDLGMKKINIVSIFLIFWTIPTLSSESNNNREQQTYLAFIDQRIQQKDIDLRRKEEHRLLVTENAKKAYEAIQTRYNALSKEKQEAYFDTLIARDGNPCCEYCNILVRSRYFPLLASSAAIAAYSALNVLLNCPIEHKQPSTVEVIQVTTYLFGCIATYISCSETCKEFDEFCKYKKTHPAPVLHMHDIPTITTPDSRKMV